MHICAEFVPTLLYNHYRYVAVVLWKPQQLVNDVTTFLIIFHVLAAKERAQKENVSNVGLRPFDLRNTVVVNVRHVML